MNVMSLADADSVQLTVAQQGGGVREGVVRFVCPLYLYLLLPHPPKQSLLNPHVGIQTETFNFQYNFTGMTVEITKVPTQGVIKFLKRKQSHQ